MADTINAPSAEKQPVRELTAVGILLRFLAALALVLCTYNPTEFSYFDWVQSALVNSTLGAMHFFVGVLLIIGWAIFLHATYESLGRLGIILALAFFGTLVWLLIDLGLLAAGSVSAVTWIVLVCLAALLTIGLSWSALWRRMTGQVDVVDSD